MYPNLRRICYKKERINVVIVIEFLASKYNLDNGELLYSCYDRARLMFKDENGEIIKDPKVISLRMMIKLGLKSKLGEMIEYLTRECDYLEQKKERGMEIDIKEYNLLSYLKDKAIDINKNNSFCMNYQI